MESKIEKITKHVVGDEKYVIKDLQPFLQKCFSNKEFKILEYKSVNLLPLGENYCSLILKIDATVKKCKSSKEETLNLVAKKMAPIDNFANWYELLPKEVFAYTELFPMFQIIESEAGIEENAVIDILPLYIGHRFSLQDSTNTDVMMDEHSLLVMENLKVKGYFTGDKQIG